MTYSLKPSGPFNQPVLVDSTGKEYGWEWKLPDGRPATAEYMKLFRAAEGVSMNKYARILGMTPMSVCRWESGRQAPTYTVYLAATLIWQTNGRGEGNDESGN